METALTKTGLVSVLLVATSSLTLQADQTTVRVRLADPGGAALVGPAYVALLRDGSRQAVPVAEVVIPPGNDVGTLQISPGSYSTLCVVPGYEPTEARNIRVTGETPESLAVQCASRALGMVHGVVIARETSRPLGGARVSPVELLIADDSSPLSAMARAFLSEHFATTTDRHGAFELPAPGGRPFTLAIQAPATATRVLEDLMLSDQRLDLGRVEMLSGGDLELALEGPSSSEVSERRVSVVEFSPDRGFQGFDSRPERPLYARLTGPDGRARWEGLPPGIYGVTLADSVGVERLVAYAVVDSGRLEFAEVVIGGGWAEVEVTGSLVERSRQSVAVSLSNRADTVELSRLSANIDEESLLLSGQTTWTGRYEVEMRGEGGEGSTWGGSVSSLELPPSGEIVRVVFDLDLHGGPVSGLAVGADGEPVPGAEITIVDKLNSTFCRTIALEDGRWRCEWAPNRSLAVLGRLEEVAVSEVVEIDGPTESVVLALRPGRTVTGRLEVPAGESAGGARVGMAVSEWPGLYFGAVTDGSGEFSISQLPALPIDVLVAPRSHSLSFASAEADPGRLADLGVLRSGFAGTAISPGPLGGSSWAGDLRSSIVADGFDLGWLPTRLGCGACLVPSQGCVLSRLPEGRHVVRWIDGNGMVVARSQPFRVVARETAVITVATE